MATALKNTEINASHLTWKRGEPGLLQISTDKSCQFNFIKIN
jgi:hypothetical protein